MEREKINQAISIIESLDYYDKKEVFTKAFSSDVLGEDLNTKLVLISTLSLMTSKLREKDPEMNPLKILMKLAGQRKDNGPFYKFLESLAILSEDLSSGCTKIDACGCKTSQELIDKIKSAVNLWLPF